jgi:heme/copper-type cytochrome/quinol oxidase subunit 2
MLFFILPATSSTIMATFVTKDFDRGTHESGEYLGHESFLAVDLTIPATGDRYQFIMMFASLMVVVYPIGVTLGLYVLLRSRRDEIEKRATRQVCHSTRVECCAWGTTSLEV